MIDDKPISIVSPLVTKQSDEDLLHKGRAFNFRAHGFNDGILLMYVSKVDKDNVLNPFFQNRNPGNKEEKIEFSSFVRMRWYDRLIGTWYFERRIDARKRWLRKWVEKHFAQQDRTDFIADKLTRGPGR